MDKDSFVAAQLTAAIIQKSDMTAQLHNPDAAVNLYKDVLKRLQLNSVPSVANGALAAGHEAAAAKQAQRPALVS